MKEILQWFSGIPFPDALAEGRLLPESKIDLNNRCMELVVDCSQPVDLATIKTLEMQITTLLKLNGMKLTVHFPKAEEPSDPAWDAYLDEADQLPSPSVSESNHVQEAPVPDVQWGAILTEAEQFQVPEEVDEKEKIAEFEQEQADKLQEYVAEAKAAVAKGKKAGEAIYGKPFKGKPMPLIELGQEYGNVIAEGDIFKVDKRETKRGMLIYSVAITDLTFSITCKLICDKNFEKSLDDGLKPGERIIVKGELSEDKYDHETVIMIKNIMLGEKTSKKDEAPEKRVELHVHTQMSAMDALAPAKDLVKTAIKWGHKAIAITDHGVLQSFPLAFKAAGDSDIKIIYGVEAYLVNDTLDIVSGVKDATLSDTFIVFDLETTGLSPVTEEIMEIGAVKVQNGKIVDTFSEFVNPGKPIPANIIELTGITDAMVEDAPDITQILPRFMQFAGDGVFVAHNASFDMSFIREACRKQNIPIENTVLDTLELSRAMFPELSKHKLNIVAKHLGVSLENHHRACDDAGAAAGILIKCFEIIEKEYSVSGIKELNTVLTAKADVRKSKAYHAIILVQNLIGLKNLYELVSEAHLNYFYRTPRIPKSIYLQHKEGLIIGSACEAGELYQALLQKRPAQEIEALADFYDYYEVQPLGNNQFMVRNGTVPNEEALKELNREIIRLGEKYHKLVVATGDVHFLNPEDAVFREVLMTAQGFDDACNQAPLYFRTTEEMLAEFSYLPEETAKEIVITNPNKIADMIEKIRPTPKETFPPKMDRAPEELTEMCYEKAKRIYGDPLPEIVATRMERELTPIVNNGYAVMYMIAQKLVAKSNSDGYLVGSRGSVGSSLVAFMAGITEVNSLVPHYVCPDCKHAEFITDGSYGSGCDMPDKACPKCGAPVMTKDGHDIPFETFLGFNADKEPDIDLNFSGDYQPVAHKYTEELFGEGFVFRAGTIGTVAEKTAFGYVLKYIEKTGRNLNNAEKERLALGCTGVKRTTGQHPGGIIVVPKDSDIHYFCPVQHPADDRESDIITTHFEYHSIDQNLLKLDILGHDDPTVIRMLEDLTGVDATTIQLDDKKTMSLFTGTEALGVTPEQIGSTVGTYGVPEFGTKFVRQMLVDTKPTTFAELVRISGLSHGTDVWVGNAQDLIVNDGLTLMDVICTRDDIMGFLIRKGLPNLASFKIMESVRKGKGLTGEQEAMMREHGVEDWYIDSCKKIQYMFPKAHAAAYVTMGFRVAYFKVNYPEEYYSTYFSIRADNFDAEFMCKGPEVAKAKKQELEQLPNPTQKEKEMITILELCIEMYARGLTFLPISLEESDGVRFKPMGEGKIRPSLNALSGLGDNAAKAIVAAREEEPFFSIEDLQTRAKLNKTVIETLRNQGCLDGMDESSQMSFF
ncbi:MAG: PolC-type DNA polymerase III [Ruminococcaceae bacterium]|nr:PolC-type DNA polymerase III [Oscillospiraceae bacterium]